MRTFRYACRPAAAVAVLGVTLLGGTAACSASATSAGSNAPATSTAATGTAAAPASTPGNALSGLTADQIATRATADLRSASSVRITGSATDAGQKMTVDLSLGTKGCTGTIGINGKGTVKVLKIGKRLWIKPDDRFWRSAGGSAAAAIMPIVSGKYIEPGSKGSSLAGMGTFCSLSQFTGSIDRHPAGLVKGVTTTISGQPALQIKDIADTASVYVSISARPEFLRFEGSGTDGRWDFSHYNEPLHLVPPPASETLDGAKYGF
jgi:hypothetical protein